MFCTSLLPTNLKRITSKATDLEFIFMKHYAPNRCEPRIKVIVKMGVRLELGGGGGQGGCERRIEAMVKCKKKSGVGVQVVTGGGGSGWV